MIPNRDVTASPAALGSRRLLYREGQRGAVRLLRPLTKNE
jgi:hypothetical protein